jgi:hypothetical protein
MLLAKELLASASDKTVQHIKITLADFSLLKNELNILLTFIVATP